MFSWGDNDHGQQGNGSTIVNQKPTAINNFGHVKVNRVACGSSHSIAWQAYEPPVCTSIEPVSFNSVHDPLGSNILSKKLTTHYAVLQKKKVVCPRRATDPVW